LKRWSETPLLLVFLCTLFENQKIEVSKLPKQEFWLYDSSIRLLLEQWDRDKRTGTIDRSGSPVRFSTEDKLSILESSALYFFEADQQVFQESKLLQRVENTLSKRGLEIPLTDRKYLSDIVDDIETNSGILKHLSPNHYTFYNRTFQEYFVVRALREIAKSGEDWLPIIAPHFWEKKWLEVCRMFVSLFTDYAFTLLERSMEFIPTEWGRLVDSFSGAGDRMIILLEDNFINWGARLNQAHIIKALSYSNCVTLITAAGATGTIDTSSVSSFPDRETRLRVAFIFLKTLELTAEEFCSIVLDWDNQDIEIVGIEDQDLYFQQIIINAKLKKAEMDGLHAEARRARTEFKKLHEQVPGIYVQNTLRHMKEKGSSIAVLTAGTYDMPDVSKELKRKNTSHFWIRAKASGSDDFEAYENMLTKGWRPDLSDVLNELNELNIDEISAF